MDFDTDISSGVISHWRMVPSVESSSVISSVSVTSSSSLVGLVGSSSSYSYMFSSLHVLFLFLFRFQTHIARRRLLLALLDHLLPVPPFQIHLAPPGKVHPEMFHSVLGSSVFCLSIFILVLLLGSFFWFKQKHLASIPTCQ